MVYHQVTKDSVFFPLIFLVLFVIVYLFWQKLGSTSADTPYDAEVRTRQGRKLVLLDKSEVKVKRIVRPTKASFEKVLRQWIERIQAHDWGHESVKRMNTPSAFDGDLSRLGQKGGISWSVREFSEKEETVIAEVMIVRKELEGDLSETFEAEFHYDIEDNCWRLDHFVKV